MSEPLIVDSPIQQSMSDDTRGFVTHQAQEVSNRTVQFTVPPGASGGQVIQIRTPGGAMLDVQLPPGVVVGTLVEIQY